jgi:arginyl-tRNA synthetase
MPGPVYRQLAKLGYDFEVQYADEDYGNNCGKLIFNPEKTGFEDIVHIREDDLANSRKYAQYLWNKYE